MLTVVVGDVVGNVDFAVRPLFPQAASRGAGVGIFVGLQLNSNVSSNQAGFIKVRSYKINTVVPLSLKYKAGSK